MRRALFWLSLWMAAGAAGAAAQAHAFLIQAAPPVGGAVAAAPKEVRLSFSEGVEPLFSAIEIATEDGRTIPTKAAAIDPADDKVLVLALPPLDPGRYRVRWRVVSVDTHRTEGEYRFAIAP